MAFILDGNFPNAFATPENVLSDSKDGSILLGLNLFQSEFQNGPMTWEPPAEGIETWLQKAMAQMLIEFMAAFARKDYEDRRERQAQGIAAAKKAGRLQPRQPNLKLAPRWMLRPHFARNPRAISSMISLFQPSMTWEHAIAAESWMWRCFASQRKITDRIQSSPTTFPTVMSRCHPGRPEWHQYEATTSCLWRSHTLLSP